MLLLKIHFFGSIENFIGMGRYAVLLFLDYLSFLYFPRLPENGTIRLLSYKMDPVIIDKRKIGNF